MTNNERPVYIDKDMHKKLKLISVEEGIMIKALVAKIIADYLKGLENA